MNILTPSDKNEDFMEHQKNYDKNESNIIMKDDDWYYNDKKYVTNSHLGMLLKGGPQHLKAYYEGEQKDTPALIFGKAQHCLLFEPELFQTRFYALDDTEICKEIGGKKPRGTTAYREWLTKVREENIGKQEIKFEDMRNINNMINKAMSYKQVREMVESAYKKEVIYQKEIKGINAKCKVDSINPSNFILDYKSTKDPATLFNAPNIIRKHGYNRQAAFYRDITGARSFWFLIQEKTYPYTVCLVEQSETSYEEGVGMYELGLDMYRKHFIENPGGIDDYLEIGMVQIGGPNQRNILRNLEYFGALCYLKTILWKNILKNILV